MEKTADCWLWRGTANQGVGVFSVGPRNLLSTHVALELSGVTVEPGLVVRHPGCGNPLCVRPEHLELGTRAEVRADVVARDAHAKGEQNGRAKLTADDVRNIRRFAALGASATNLGHLFDVDPKAIRQILQGKTWRHVGAEGNDS